MMSFVVLRITRSYLALSLSLFSLSPFSLSLFFYFVDMGVQREPGQKGVNWSNIAVGKFESEFYL